MKIRSLMLSMAAGVVATLAFVTPSQAGSTLVTTDLTVSITSSNGGTPTLTDIQIQYSSVDPISDLKVTGGTLTGVVLTEPHPNLVEVTFDRSSGGTVDFTFLTGAAAGSVTGIVTGHSGIITGDHNATLTSSAVVTSVAVPEPASIALLGIGMTGFLAFRRFFKKTSVA
jgi:hypothetical protein